MEAKYEEETEAVQQEIGSKQLDLTSKIKRAEENLAQMTQQQTDMMEQTKSEVSEARGPVCICVGVRVFMYVCVYLCMYAYVWVCMLHTRNESVVCKLGRSAVSVKFQGACLVIASNIH